MVRVEPSGDSVIAGRAEPGTRVDLVVDGRIHATTTADGAGDFALVAPPLPVGSHEIVLETSAPDGTRTRSAQSVTVVISEGRREAPLVTVTAPGRPVEILSSPDDRPVTVASAPAPTRSAPAATGPATPVASPVTPIPEPSRPAAAAPPAAPGAPAASPSASSPVASPAAPPPIPVAPSTPARSPIRIASVESEAAGRLYVSGTAAPGATVRLYLNETFVAAATAEPDGRVAFSIERGIRPGAYRVRLDEVDPASGTVRSRVEVAFTAPPAGPTPPAAPAPAVVAAATPRNVQGGQGPPAVSIPPAAPAVAPPSPGIPTAGGDPALSVVPTTPIPAAPAAAPAVIGARPVAAAPTPAARPAATSQGAGGQRAAAVAPVGRVAPAATVARMRYPGPRPVVVPEVNTAMVSRGDSLWEISRRTYGDGVRYTVIYGANAQRIRDPNLIYPGQIFVLPGKTRPPR